MESNHHLAIISHLPLPLCYGRSIIIHDERRYFMSNFCAALIVSCIVLIALSFAVMCALSAAADICYIRTRNKLVESEEDEDD